jgi:hypothetical protein
MNHRDYPDPGSSVKVIKGRAGCPTSQMSGSTLYISVFDKANEDWVRVKGYQELSL